MELKSASFVLGKVRSDELPAATVPEIAVVGRSNVGKSSFINRITQRRNLARTSSTPGRTQEINLFDVRLRSVSGEVALMLADLPGYGYAKLSHGQRRSLARTISYYLSEREGLKLICLLNDCRRDPEEEELQVRDHAFEREIPLLVVITKFDKLNRAEQRRRIKEICAGYGLEESDLFITDKDSKAAPFWLQVSPLLEQPHA